MTRIAMFLIAVIVFPVAMLYVTCCAVVGTIVRLINKKEYLHRIVAMAFIPNPENKKCVNLKDGNKHNNIVDNLEWTTQSENNTHAYRVLGKDNPQLGKIGSLNAQSKPVYQLKLSGEIIKEWESISTVGRTLKIDNASISMCCNGKRNFAKGFKWEFVNKQKN